MPAGLVLRMVALCCLLPTSTGCQAIKNLFREPAPALPARLPANASKDQIINVVNGNSARIQSFTAPSASISVSQLPIPLAQTTIEYERPRSLRIKGSPGAFVPTMLDAGSNNELMWLWINHEPRAVIYCRHEDYYDCPARDALPINPYWLVEALGVVEFRPDEIHEGPTVTQNGQYQIQSRRQTPDGMYTRVATIDANTGAVVSQALWDDRGNLLGAAYAREHSYDLMAGVVMPGVVRIDVPQPGSRGANPPMNTVEVTLGRLEINRSQAGPNDSFMLPTYPNSPRVDLCKIACPPGPAMPQQASRSTAPSTQFKDAPTRFTDRGPAYSTSPPRY